MKIQQINFPRINNIAKKKEDNCIQKSQLTTDCFEKSKNVSFRGSLLDELFGDSFIDSFLGTVNLFSKTLQKYHQELRIQAAIILFSDTTQKNKLSRLKQVKLEDIFGHVQDFKPAFPLFKKSNIITVSQMEQFVKNYNRGKKTCDELSGQAIEAVEIHGILKDKEDLANYPDLLLHTYNKESKEENPNYNKLNEYTSFLKKVGIRKYSDFDEKFEHLKPQFNDFESITDRVDALEYEISTYSEKINLLSEVIKKVPNIANKDATKVYATICDIVDYYYDKNSGKSLSNIEDIIELALSHNKLKLHSLKQLEMNKKTLKSAEQKIDFYEFLNSCDISIADFNAIATKSFIEDSDYDVMNQLINKKYLSECIQKLIGCEQSEATDIYRRFKDVINTTYDEENGSLQNLETIIELSIKYNIKNSDGILRLYNEITGQNRKTMSKEELCNFIELFQYSTSKNILEDAKTLKTKAIILLEEEKQFYEKIKPEIEEYIQNDTSKYFTGESALTIYKKHAKLFREAGDNVHTILEIISGKDVKAIEKKQQKDDEVSLFTKYFDSQDEAIKFINANNISFNNTKNEIEYKENCLAILDALYDENNTNKSKKRIEHITESGFLVKSRNRLTEFLRKIQNPEKRKKVLAVISDKKIPSLNILEKFLRTYHTEKTSDYKLFNFILNLPEGIDFNHGSEIINKAQEKIEDLNLPAKITAENIHLVDLSQLESADEFGAGEIIGVLESIHKSTNGKNFLTALEESKDETNIKYTKHKIATELVWKMKTSKESYQNIIRLLGLERSTLGLPYSASNYLYIDAIEEELPDEFVDFVNSNEWLNIGTEENNDTPNIVLHARLRAIDRFALNEAQNISELYTQATKEKLKSLFKTVYTEKPIDIKGSDTTKRIIVNHIYNSNVIEAVFSPKGKMITIVQKRT